MVRVVAPLFRAFDVSPWSREIERLIDGATAELEALARFNDPRGTYAYCFCEVR